MELDSRLNGVVKMIKRSLEEQILKSSKQFPVVLLTGPRQVGKTTLLENISKDREYVSLDDFEQRSLAVRDPKLFLGTHPAPVFIDEIQYAPGLFSYIKMYVDKHKRNGDFWISGSQKFHLMKNVSESLAGRVAVLDLLGISQAEIQNRKNRVFLPDDNWKNSVIKDKIELLDVSKLYERIYRGTYPKLIANSDIATRLFYSSYIQTYVERDIRSLINIGDELKFITFLKVLAARSATLINYSDIASSVDVDVKTAQAWVSILMSTGIITLLYPYHNNLIKRVIKTPKIYFLDTGLCSYLSGWDSGSTLMNGPMDGSILETYVYSEILKSYWNSAITPNIYFYRDTDQKEIDFLIETNGTLYPIEVKKTASPSNVKTHFEVLKHTKKPIAQGTILCLYDSILPITEKVLSIPINYI